jgi:thiol:disulfide interchange protein
MFSDIHSFIREISMRAHTPLILTIAFLAAVTAASQENAEVLPSYEPVTKFDSSRDAAKDIAAAAGEAKRTGRHVLVDVGGDWCIWCKRLDAFFDEQKDVAEFLRKNYVAVKVNYSKESKNEAVLSRYPKVAGYPHLFVLDGDGKLLHSQDTGVLESGKGHDREKVLAFLKQWAPQGGPPAR